MNQQMLSENPFDHSLRLRLGGADEREAGERNNKAK